MSLLRFAGRVLFSSYYVADGYQLLTKPDQNADDFAPAVDRVVPTVQSFLPPDTADRVPEDARTWARLMGIVQIVGGVAYATGWARRPGAALLALASLPRLFAASQSDDRPGLLGQLALFGAAVTATQDTAGRPGLAWRAKQSKKVAGKTAQKASGVVSQAQKAARKKARKVRHQVKGATS